MRSNQRPDTLMQDRICRIDETSCNARPDHTFGSDSVLPNHANLVHFTSDNRRGRRRLGPERREDQQLASRACDGDVKAAVAAFVVGRGYLGGDAAVLVRTDGHREDDDVPFVALHILDVLDQDGFVRLVEVEKGLQ
jgi:hypothetical protein